MLVIKAPTIWWVSFPTHLERDIEQYLQNDPDFSSEYANHLYSINHFIGKYQVWFKYDIFGSPYPGRGFQTLLKS